MAKAIDARRLSLDTLNSLQKSGKLPKQAMEEYIHPLEAYHLGEVDVRERAFFMELTYGVLRYRDRLDWILKQFLKSPSSLGISTVNNLRLALYQIVFMRVPKWAAVNEAVNLEKSSGKPAVVNAVLRNFLRREGEITLPAIDKSAVEHISVASSHPRWLVKRWVQRFGVSEALALANSNNVPPPITLAANTLKTTREELIGELLSMGIECQPTAYGPRGVRLKKHVPYGLLEPVKGKAFVQDEASQLVSMTLCPEAGQRILDACAAPGGKACHLAILTGDGAEITALDRTRRRVDMINENTSALGLGSIRAMVGDIRQTPLQGEFDRIIIDAPCSSLGVIRKNPDVKYRYKPENLRELAENQLSLLHAASRYLKKDGMMVYSVCSTEPEEGEEVVKNFLKKNPGYYIIESAGLIKGIHGVDYSVFISGHAAHEALDEAHDEALQDGFYRTYPHKYGPHEDGLCEDGLSQSAIDEHSPGEIFNNGLDGFFFATIGRNR